MVKWSTCGAPPRAATALARASPSDDGFAPEGEALAKAVAALGGAPQVLHFTTDHPYSDHRIALQQTVGGWLAELRP